MADSRDTPPDAEAVWREIPCRKLGGPPILDHEGVQVADALVTALSSAFEYADPEEHRQACERLGDKLKAAKVRAEDAAAERLGFPPRPRPLPR